MHDLFLTTFQSDINEVVESYCRGNGIKHYVVQIEGFAGTDTGICTLIRIMPTTPVFKNPPPNYVDFPDPDVWNFTRDDGMETQRMIAGVIFDKLKEQGYTLVKELPLDILDQELEDLED